MIHHTLQKFIAAIALSTMVALLAGQSSINLTFHQLTEEDGLLPAEKYFISQDQDGLVWFGTNDGLQRFDGRQLVNFSIDAGKDSGNINTNITSQCLVDDAGNLWFSTVDGLHCYRKSSCEFLYFQAPSTLRSYQALYIDQQGVLWLRIGTGTAGSLWTFDIKTRSFTQGGSLPGREVIVLPNKKGEAERLASTALTGQAGLILTKIASNEKQHIEFLKTTSGSARNFSSPTRGCFMDEDGIIWTGTYNGIGFVLPGEHEGIVARDRAEFLPNDLEFINVVQRFDDKHLIVAADKGLFLFDKKNRKFVHQFKRDQFQSNSFSVQEPNNIYTDGQGNVWISGSQGEIAFTNPAKHRFPALQASIGKSVTTMSLGPQGHVWWSTLQDGTFVYDQEKKHLRQSLTLDNEFFPGTAFPLPALSHFLQQDENGWWAYFDNHFLHWEASKQLFEFKDAYFPLGHNISNQVINCCYPRLSGEHLIANGANIYGLLLEAQRVDTLPWYNIEYLQLGTINMVWEDSRQQIYVADEQGRLIVFQEQNGELIKVADHEKVGTCYAIQEDLDRQTIWIASSKGLASLHPETHAYRLLNAENDGLPNELFYNAILDGSGRLWLPGNHGLVRYLPETKSAHRFTTTDGLLSSIFNKSTSLYLPATGEIWLGGKNGVNVFHPDSINLILDQPSIRFSRILINDGQRERVCALNELQDLNLEYAENTLSFEYLAVDYSDPTANEYYYQMEGIDGKRIWSGNNTFVRYPNLAAGNYTFKVWATNANKLLKEEPVSLAITIIPPYYQRTWFYVLCALLISSIVYGIFRYRLEQALKMERLRVKISSDLHDDVGGMLSGLAMQSEILELTAQDDVKPKLARIAELSRTAMSRMRDTVWAIDARKDQVKNLIDRMREHAEETLDQKGIQYSINSSSLNLEEKLATDVRQNIYLIYKEAVTNVARHSNGDTVNIDLQEGARGFTMSIHDNGKIAPQTHRSAGLGRSNMQMRAEAINAALTIETENGFRVTLRRKQLYV